MRSTNQHKFWELHFLPRKFNLLLPSQTQQRTGHPTYNYYTWATFTLMPTTHVAGLVQHLRYDQVGNEIQQKQRNTFFKITFKICGQLRLRLQSQNPLPKISRSDIKLFVGCVLVSSQKYFKLGEIPPDIRNHITSHFSQRRQSSFWGRNRK